MDIRITYAIDPKLNHDCDKIHIDSYELQEVILSPDRQGVRQKAIHIVVHGRNFKAVAQPLRVMVGKEQVLFLRIAPDERSVEGILTHIPEEGATVDVILGDQDHARHPATFKREMLRRIK